MAHGTSGLKNALFFKIKTKNCDPHFEVKKRTDSGYVTLENDTFIEGHLIKVVKSPYKYEGDEVRAFTLHLKDGEELYVLGCSYTNISRSLINCLANMEFPGKIKLSLYKKKDSSYAALYVENDGEKVSWKYEYDEWSDLIVVSEGTKGKQHKDFDALDDYFEEILFTEVAPRVSESNTYEAQEASKPPVSKEIQQEETESSSEEKLNEATDDLPF